MNRQFVKFPSTPHLHWLGASSPREDKVLSSSEAIAFLEAAVTVEEKIDGANLGVSFDSHGHLLAQNRGSFLKKCTKGQFAPLWTWLTSRESRLFDVLEDRLIIFGEWCYARHSIHYTALPDFFLPFDVFDKCEQQFFNVHRRDQVIRDLDLSVVPKLGEGTFQLEEIIKLVAKSRYYDGPMEGVYLRQDGSSWLIGRAKVVRAEFAHQIGEHWSKQPLVPNRLAGV